jgi:hypothetical protein
LGTDLLRPGAIFERRMVEKNEGNCLGSSIFQCAHKKPANSLNYGLSYLGGSRREQAMALKFDRDDAPFNG